MLIAHSGPFAFVLAIGFRWQVSESEMPVRSGSFVSKSVSKPTPPVGSELPRLLPGGRRVRGEKER